MCGFYEKKSYIDRYFLTNQSKRIVMPIKITLLIAFVVVSFTQAQNRWSLEQCIDYALKNNISIKQSEVDLKMSDIEQLQARGAFFPSVNSNLSYQLNEGKNINPVTNQFQNAFFQSASGGVNLSVNLFSGLQNWRRLRLAQINALAAQYSLDKMKDDILLMIVNSYLEIISNKEQIKTLRAQHEITKQNFQRTSDLIEAGALPKGDIFEVEAQLMLNEQQIILAENALFISKMGLAQLLLLKDYHNFEVADSSFEVPNTDILSKSPAEIFNKSKEVIQDLKLAQAQVELAQTNYQLARSAQAPRLSAFMGYNSQWSKNFPDDFWSQVNANKGLSSGLSLSIPIFNGFSTSANVKRQKMNLLKAQLSREQTELTAERTVYQAYNDAVNARKLYEATQKTAESKEQAFRYAQERYEVGLMSIFDFNQVKNQYENAQNEYIRTKYQYIFKLKVLQYYFGIDLTQDNFS